MILKLKKSFVPTQFRSTSSLRVILCELPHEIWSQNWIPVVYHITPVLRQLHWLPVRQRIHFKIAGWVFQALHWPAKHPPTSPRTAAWYQTRTVADSAFQTLELVSPPTGVTKSKSCSGRSGCSGPNLKISRHNPCSPFFSVSYSINRHKIL